MDTIAETAAALFSDGKGILAADESLPTIHKRFEPHGIGSTVESRRAYREMLFTAPNIERSISGVIMFEETLRQQCADGQPFAALLAGRGIIPGIKVDTGTSPFGQHGEWKTEGLEGLVHRLQDYADLGARFAKWRAVFRVEGSQVPSAEALARNARALAKYAALCQLQNILPIVEPELLIEGEHDMARARAAATEILEAVFRGLEAAGVSLEGVILKTAFVTPGSGAAARATNIQIAEATLDVLKQNVPWMVAGVAFLSGGHSPEESTAIFRRTVAEAGRIPWPLTFSFGRALQEEALTAWDGNDQYVEAAQQIFAARAASLADIGRTQLPILHHGER